MDIAALSIALNQNKVQEQASLSVLKMAMSVDTHQGEAITSLAREATKAMELAVQPNLGVALDTLKPEEQLPAQPPAKD